MSTPNASHDALAARVEEIKARRQHAEMQRCKEIDKKMEKAREEMSALLEELVQHKITYYNVKDFNEMQKKVLCSHFHNVNGLQAFISTGPGWDSEGGPLDYIKLSFKE